MAEPISKGMLMALAGAQAGGQALSSLLQPGVGGQKIRGFDQQFHDILFGANGQGGFAPGLFSELTRSQQQRDRPINLPGRDISGMIGSAQIAGLPTGTVGLMPGLTKFAEPRRFNTQGRQETPQKSPEIQRALDAIYKTIAELTPDERFG